MYEGGYRDGVINGQGTYTFHNGTKYVGEHKDKNKHGQGTFTYSDGRRYVGEWKNDKRWNVIIYDKNGNITGRFVNGKRSLGKGKEIGVLYVGVRNDEFGFYKE